jgi:hypothetical protein
VAIDCTPDALAAAAKCFKCPSGTTLLEIQTYLLCQILNNGGTGGGGVSQLMAGTNITLNPVGGTGVVTINSSGAPAEFQSGLFTLGSTQIANVAHGLGAMPQNFGARMRCVVADLTSGMQVGDESEASCWFDSNSVIGLFNVIATVTNVIVTSSMVIIGGEGNVVVPNRNGGASNILSGNNFRIKIYASL